MFSLDIIDLVRRKYYESVIYNKEDVREINLSKFMSFK